MLVTHEDESAYQVRNNSYVFPVLFLCIPPLMLIELGPGVLDGSIKTGELVGLFIGILLPLAGAYYYIEFASFTFSRTDGVFHWRWRNLFSKKTGQVPFSRIAKVRRDAIETGDSGGLKYSHRLVVILDDNTIIPLTRGYSGLHSKKLDQTVDQIRDYIGQSSAMH